MLLIALFAGILVYYAALIFQQETNEKRLVQRRLERLRWSFLDSVKLQPKKKAQTVDRFKRKNFSPDSNQFKNYSLIGMTLAIFIEFKFSALWSKAILVVAAVFFLYRFIYLLRRKQREEKIRTELPGVLDLMVICLGSGLGLNAAFERISKELDETPLAVELRRMVGEMKAGMPPEEALKGLYARTQLPEVVGLMGHVIQSQKIGASLLEAFQIQAASIRERMKIKIKEHLMKIPVKALFPMVFFMLPVIFALLLGPAAVNMLRSNFFS